MKKLLLFIVMASLFVLVACGEDKSQDTSADSDEKKPEESEEAVEVDKGILNVEVTLPASFVEGENIDELTAEAKESGVKEVTKNEDGSVTYKMSKSAHKELMKEMEAEINTYMDDIVNGEDFTSIHDVESKKSFSEFTLSVDQEGFENSLDGFATLGLGMQGLFYQLFNGVDSDDYEVIIHVENAENGEVIHTVHYPEALENMEE